MEELREIKIPRVVEKIIERLEKAGFEAYAVGGCVRDSLIGRIPQDWDITTSALPHQVKKVFKRTVDTGIEHGTVTVLMGGEDSICNETRGYEVTTYRIDGEYCDARHPSSVTFTPSLVEDLARRDFTINAMAYNKRDGIVDAFGGMKDLDARIIRAVGTAEKRFEEDALRMLRAIRFAAQLDFGIEENTQNAICLLAGNLIHVSKERIAVELSKLLVSDYPERMELVFKTRLSDSVCSGFSSLAYDAFLKVSEDKEQLKKIEAKRYLRWALFLSQTESRTAGKILKELKFDNQTIKNVEILTEALSHSLPKNEYEIRTMLSRMGDTLFFDFLLLHAACESAEGREEKRPLSHAEIYSAAQKILKRGDCISMKTLAVGGADLVQAGIKPGPQMGKILAELFETVLKEPEKNRKEVLLALLSDPEC